MIPLKFSDVLFTSESSFCKSIIFCLSISWSETTSRRHIVKVSTFELETESFDSKVWISSRENLDSFLSSEVSKVSMLSQMALKVISVCQCHYQQVQPLISFS